MTRNPRHNPDPRVTENQRAFLLGVAVSCARRKDGISGVLPSIRLALVPIGRARGE